jgi:beta-glucosidase-like glycosyl hydrolase
MVSYNSVDGIPTCGSKGLLTEILRDQWDWDGFVVSSTPTVPTLFPMSPALCLVSASISCVDWLSMDPSVFDAAQVSDYDAWANILKTHHYVDTMEDAAAVGINAGLDQEGGGTSAISALAQAVSDGKVKKETVATAFRRLFRIRIRLGMLVRFRPGIDSLLRLLCSRPAYPLIAPACTTAQLNQRSGDRVLHVLQDPPNSMLAYNLLNGTQAQSPEHLNITKTAAVEGMTLLKNSNKALPLSAAKFAKAGSLCVIGPQAIMAGLLMGNYAEVSPDCCTQRPRVHSTLVASRVPSTQSPSH